MRGFGLGAIFALSLGMAANAAPVAPDFFFTAHDSGNNGLGVNAPSTPSHPVFTPQDFVINYSLSAILLRGSVGPQTSDRKSYGFLFFDLPGITSVSSATLSFGNRSNFYLNTTGFPAATPEIGITALAMQSSTSFSVLDAAVQSSGTGQTSFTTSAPATSTYALDITSLINGALSARSSGETVALYFENIEDFASLPSDVNNGGYGNIDFQNFSLDAVAGPAPDIGGQVPLPAPALMLLSGLAGLGVMRARKRKS